MKREKDNADVKFLFAPGVCIISPWREIFKTKGVEVFISNDFRI